jgi:ribosomal protein S18 acetylase RimI-like enzyme
MPLELAPPKPDYVPELGRIFYEAFLQISTSHGFSPDLPSIDVARQVMGMLVSREDFHGVVALLDGRPVGSNFMSLMDAVGGVGPITVDPAVQSRGIGRALMQSVLDHARHRGIGQVRLLQDAYNVTSLSLYASLGFEAREEVALMEYSAEPGEPHPSIRPFTEEDLPAIEALGRHHYKVSRRNEVAASPQYGFPVFVHEQEAQVTGYFLPGLLGHGMAATEEEALILVSEAARRQPNTVRFFCPLSEARLFRETLRFGCRVVKVMTLMAIGPYEQPEAVWMPSVLY